MNTASLEHTEVWRPIPGFENYSASSAGAIRRDAGGHGTPGRLKTLSIVDKKYQLIRLVRADGKIFSRRVHILVALTFIGPKPTPEHEVNHKNGNRLDNRASNLEYVTSVANERHAAVNALKAWGEKHGQHKLTAEAVRFIRANPWLTCPQLGANFGVSKGCIQSVRSGHTWRHLV